MRFRGALVRGFEGRHDCRAANVRGRSSVERDIQGGGLTLADQVGDAHAEIVGWFALVEKVVLDHPDRESPLLLTKVVRNFDRHAGQLIAPRSPENAVEGLFHLGQEIEGDVDVRGRDL